MTITKQVQQEVKDWYGENSDNYNGEEDLDQMVDDCIVDLELDGENDDVRSDVRITLQQAINEDTATA